jgi:LPS export ABC transporter protein LptC
MTAKKHNYMNSTSCIAVILLITAMHVLISSCSGEKVHTAPAVNDKDSLPFMQAKGISNLISDSGIIRYKIIAENWNIYNTTNPPKWTFLKGLLLEKFDTTFHVEWFVQADTAYCYNQKLWELRGRVVVRNVEGTVFKTEELFWDMSSHEVYSNMYVRIITPEREVEGTRFRSNEQMTRYTFYNSKGSLPFNDAGSASPQDSVVRQGPAKPI